jgi:molybdate transport system substrate-binding protein
VKKNRYAAALAALLLVPGLAGCGSGDKTLTVFAAASLQEPFTALAKQFEKDHKGVKVELSFGASNDLTAQIQQGAPADVIATASTATMDQIDGDITDRADFASNTMEIAIPAGNPGHIHSLADLARKGVKLAVCQAEVPCGTVAAKVFANAKMTVHPVTEEVDVKSVLTKVSLGEVDAGIVYVSDVKTAGPKVTGITIPAAVNAITTYPIATVTKAKQKSLAADFVELVEGDAGRTALAASGFAPPAQ